MANGTQPMRFGGRDPYSNINFGSNVDWADVNPRLLQAVQRVAAQRGVMVNVNSGYRSNAYSAKVGGFAGDPHSRGIAIDAYIGGKPIGSVIPASVWRAMGVRSGDTFTYHGATDPEHLDLVGMPGGNLPAKAPQSPAQATPATQLAQSLMTGGIPPQGPNPIQNLIQYLMAGNSQLIQQRPTGFQPF